MYRCIFTHSSCRQNKPSSPYRIQSHSFFPSFPTKYFSPDGLFLYVCEGTLLRALDTIKGQDAWNTTVAYTYGGSPCVQHGANGALYALVEDTYYAPAPPPTPPAPPSPSEPYWVCGANYQCVPVDYGSLNLSACEQACVPQQPQYSITVLAALDPITGARVGPAILPNKTDPGQSCNQSLNLCLGWGYPVGEENKFPVAVSDDVAIGVFRNISTGFTAITAINLTTGAPIWARDTSGIPSLQLSGSSFAFSPDNTIFYFAGGTEIGAYSVTDGSNIWQYNGIGTFSQQSLQVTPDNKFLIAGNSNGFIYALDAQIGGVQWIFNAGGPITSSIQFIDSFLYVTCTNGVVYSLHANNGTEHWSFRTGYPIEGSAAVTPTTGAPYRTFFGADDGQVYALSP